MEESPARLLRRVDELDDHRDHSGELGLRHKFLGFSIPRPANTFRYRGRGASASFFPSARFLAVFGSGFQAFLVNQSHFEARITPFPFLLESGRHVNDA